MEQEAFDTFWYWIRERYWIYKQKALGFSKPWSEDPIFQNWKFCNVFRKHDTQSKLLIENIIEPNQDAMPEILLFNIFMFRAFNWWPTYELIGWTEQWDHRRVSELMTNLQWKGEKITSGAYMLRGRQGMPKGQSIVMTLDEMWRKHKKRLVHVMNVHNSLQEVTVEISSNDDLWGWADFTAYQVALDLTYSPLMPDPHDINEWCAFGPGAERGIKLIFPELKPSGYIDAAKFLLSEQYEHLENRVPVMTLQDIEFSLCELGKYMRIKNGGRSKEKYNGRN